MRLRKIRLAGFKSFVDPTTIELPGNVVGVVGPNGGGKSNVIDAVRWVMGEVSARSLRGATMADVVFNGSSSRKPVSGASVELSFDNLDGRAGGRFAAYNEISVRRQLTREGQSTYWLNGTRCRRRDVMDVFHGTGLGPRSYAIIEQGMISRIIEAKPGDLRDFLEEAAGISKYKERRRETENRMRHTIENLERLNDLRDELARRLAHLKRQAALAEKFRELKAAQRRLEAEHLALRWRAHDEEASRRAELVEAQRTRLEAVLADQRRIEADLEKVRGAHTEATEAYNRRYRDVLDAGAGIARVEESIRSLRQRREELAANLRQETGRLDSTRQQIQREHARREDLARQIALDGPALAELHDRTSDAHRELCDIEGDVHALQTELDSLIERERDPARAVHAEQARIQHLESSIEELETRAADLEEERGSIDPGSMEREAEPLRLRIEAMEKELERAEAEQSRTHEAVRRLRGSVQAAARSLGDVREVLGRHRGRVASLEVLQQEALGPGSGVPPEWLEARGVAASPRLAQAMRVTPGWEHAVEAVLGVRLQAVRSDRFDAMAVDAAALEQGALTAVDASIAEPAVDGSAHALETLRSKVETDWPIAGLLEGILCAPSLDEGLMVRSRLAAGESVVTAQGVWIGPTWLHVRRGGVGEFGVLAREQELEALAGEIERASAGEDAGAREVEALSRELRIAEDALSSVQGELADGHRRCAVLRTELGARSAEAEQASRRSAALGAEMADVASRIEAGREKLAAAYDRVRRGSTELDRLGAERSRCDARRRARSDELARARERWQGLHDGAHTLELRVEVMRSRHDSSEEAIERDRRQLEELEQRRTALGDSLREIEAPLAQGQESLDELLRRRTSLEAVMRAARTEVERVEERMRRTDEDRQRRAAAVQGGARDAGASPCREPGGARSSQDGQGASRCIRPTARRAAGAGRSRGRARRLGREDRSDGAPDCAARPDQPGCD